MIRPPSTFQWLLYKHVREGMQRQLVAKKEIIPQWQCAAAAMVIGMRYTGDMYHVFHYDVLPVLFSFGF